MKKILFSMFLIIIIVSGCSSQEDNKKLDELQSRLDDLMEQVIDINERQLQFEEEFKFYDSQQSLDTNNHHTRLYQLEHLVKYLPNIELKKGYILEVIKEDNSIKLAIDFKRMISDDNQPNGYRIEEMEDELVELTEETDIYMLENHSREIYVPIEELEEKLNEYTRFINFYFVDGKVLLMTEQYLP